MSSRPQSRPMNQSKSTCLYCGVTSSFEEGYVDASSFRRGPGKCCITCKAYRDMFPGFYVNFAIGAAVALVIGFQMMESVAGAVAFAIAVYVAAYVTIMLHELAHAGAATLVGVGVPVFSVGGGRRLRVTRFAGRWLILGLAPSEGLIYTTYHSRNWFRAKTAFILAAGPLANFACAAIGYAWLGRIEGGLPVYVETAAEIFVVFSLLSGIMNLIPFRSQTPYGPMSSDGQNILDLFSMSEEQVGQAIDQTTFVVAYFEFLFGDKSAVVEMLEPLLVRGDASIAIKILASAAYAETGEIDKGAALCRAALETDGLDTTQHAALLNNLACVLVFKGTLDALAEADSLSKEAYELTPMVLAVRATRASTLVETGREEEALDLICDRRFRIEPKPTQAGVLCTQALAYSKLGRADLASMRLAQATRLAPESDHVARTKSELKGMRSSERK